MRPARHLGGLVVALALSAAPAAATSDPTGGQIAGPALEAAFSGAAYHGSYQNGVGWYETYRANGRLYYRDDLRSAEGDWYIEDDLLCTFYDGGLRGGCFIVVARTANCLDFYVVDPQTNQPEAGWDAVRRSVGWTARGGRAKQARTCPEDLVT